MMMIIKIMIYVLGYLNLTTKLYIKLISKVYLYYICNRDIYKKVYSCVIFIADSYVADCPPYSECKPLVFCASDYPHIRHDPHAACVLHSYAKGVCCPIKNKKPSKLNFFTMDILRSIKNKILNE